MKISPRLRTLGACALLSVVGLPGATAGSRLQIEEFAPLPDDEGFAGMFAASTRDHIIAAGGHHFPGGIPPWQGGTKFWSDAIYVYSKSTSSWRKLAARLPNANGDGLAVAYRDEVICIGGGDAKRAFSSVFALKISGDRISTRPLPDLPAPRIKMSGALIGDVMYVVGGRAGPNTPSTESTFWALDLSAPKEKQRWIELPPLPGPGRMMAVVAVVDRSLYVVGGIEVGADAKGAPVNRAPYLRDAFRYTVALPVTAGSDSRAQIGRWEKLAAPPRPVAAAPSPAFVSQNEILILGGVDGSIEAITERGTIKELPGDILRYDLRANRWDTAGQITGVLTRVNAPSVPWDGAQVVISGEFLPARRTRSCLLVKSAP